MSGLKNAGVGRTHSERRRPKENTAKQTQKRKFRSNENLDLAGSQGSPSDSRFLRRSISRQKSVTTSHDSFIYSHIQSGERCGGIFRREAIGGTCLRLHGLPRLAGWRQCQLQLWRRGGWGGGQHRQWRCFPLQKEATDTILQSL